MVVGVGDIAVASEGVGRTLARGLCEPAHSKLRSFGHWCGKGLLVESGCIEPTTLSVFPEMLSISLPEISASIESRQQITFRQTRSALGGI